jgi:hypothetical protein
MVTHVTPAFALLLAWVTVGRLHGLDFEQERGFLEKKNKRNFSTKEIVWPGKI